MFSRGRRRRGSNGRTGWISRENRLAIYERDGFSCLYCDSTHYLQLDHIHPRSKGGSDKARNLATCCRACNLSKSNRIIPGRTRRAKIANYRLTRMTLKRKNAKNTSAQRIHARQPRGTTKEPHEDGTPHWGWVIILLVILVIT